MSRVFGMVAALVLVPALAGCSLSPRTLTMGFTKSEADQGRPQAPLFQRDFAPVRKKAAQKPAPQPRQKLAALVSPPRRAVPPSIPSASQLNVEVARRKINTYRASKGLRPLQISVKLTSAARMHARDLSKWDRISHYGSDGSNPWDRVKRTGFKARLAAENVGTGQKTFEEVLTGWKNSPGHNKNLLLADATHMGIALVKAPNTEFKTFWTLVLGTPM